MKPAEIIATARRRMDNVTEPPLVSDEDHMLALAEAEDEAAVRASLLYDDSSDFLTIPLVAGQRAYALDPRIWRIDHVAVVLPTSDRAYDVELTGIDMLERSYLRLSSGARPLCAAHVRQALHVWPTPRDDVQGEIRLTVYRHPLKPVAMDDMDDAAALEIDTAHHAGLVDWLLFRAYSIKDEDTFNPTGAGAAEQAFIARFGERPDANTQRKHNERRRTTTPYGGF